MKITILCSSKEHPIYPMLEKWRNEKSNKHDISLLTDINEVKNGDVFFLISFTKIVKEDLRNKFKHSLVIHASDLPEGKGWSPHIWQILQGANKITVSLFDAIDNVDAGDIWAKRSFSLEGHELYDEINKKLFEVELDLMNYAIDNVEKIKPQPQSISDSPHFPRRKPEDSEIDPQKSIAEQFELIRVCDVNRFPCFFYFRGKRYKIVVTKYDEIK